MPVPRSTCRERGPESLDVDPKLGLKLGDAANYLGEFGVREAVVAIDVTCHGVRISDHTGEDR
jgi:hypothetical protein